MNLQLLPFDILEIIVGFLRTEEIEKRKSSLESYGRGGPVGMLGGCGWTECGLEKAKRLDLAVPCRESSAMRLSEVCRALRVAVFDEMLVRTIAIRIDMPKTIRGVVTKDLPAAEVPAGVRNVHLRLTTLGVAPPEILRTAFWTLCGQSCNVQSLMITWTSWSFPPQQFPPETISPSEMVRKAPAITLNHIQTLRLDLPRAIGSLVARQLAAFASTVHLPDLRDLHIVCRNVAQSGEKAHDVWKAFMQSLSMIDASSLEVVRLCFNWNGDPEGFDLWRVASMNLLRHFSSTSAEAPIINLCLTFTDRTLYNRLATDDGPAVREQSLRSGILPSENDWDTFKHGLTQFINVLSAVKFRLQILHLKTYDRALVERVFYGEIDSGAG